MTMKKHGRTYDLVLLGATGYTGKYTVDHITRYLPTNLKWAIAGRSETKLQALVDESKATNPDRSPPSIEITSVDDLKSLETLVKKTYVLLTTVGPYVIHGENAFKACAEAGTHYVDVTGESAWTARMINKYEQTARESGAMMFPQSGIESAPADLCTWMLARCLKDRLDAQTGEVTVSVHRLKSAPSGGTLATVFSIFDHIPLSELRKVQEPFSISPVPHPESPRRPKKSLFQTLFGTRYIRNLGITTTSLAGTTDAVVVERTWGLLSTIPSRKDEFYGPRFRWQEVWRARNWLHGIGQHLAIMVSVLMIACFPFVRSVAKKCFYQPGEGRSKEETANETIEYRGIAAPDTQGDGRLALVKAWYHGGMYYLTGMLLGQAAMTLLEDDVGLDGGIYTPACLGQGFVDRLDQNGFKMETKIIRD